MQNLISRKRPGLALTLAFLLSGTDAYAGSGSITFGPVSSPIPTLSGSMLVVLALLFAIVAFRVLRSHAAGKPLSSLVAVTVLGLSVASGSYLTKSLQAAPVYDFIFSTPSGTVGVNNNGLNTGQNQSGGPIQIISVNPYSCLQAASTTPYSPQCVSGLIVQNNGICYVNMQPIC